MIRRAFWFVSGVGVGVYGSFRAAQAAKKLAPDHVARRAAAQAKARAGDVREAVIEGRTAMRQREQELEAELRSQSNTAQLRSGPAGPRP